MNIIFRTNYGIISLKGGEIMYFRGLIVKSLIAGTALFFPTDAFADKAEPAQR